jgi:transposase-like protein
MEERVKKPESPEDERSGTGGDSGRVAQLRKNQGPNPEVADKPKRRTFSAGYKLRILEEIDQCKEGEVASVLRREGLYYANIDSWQKQRALGTLSGLQPKKRGPRTKAIDPDYVRKLEQENERLRKKLQQAEGIIDIQKKMAEILGTDKNENK